MNRGNLGDRFVQWAEFQPTIRAVIMLGSRVRPANALDAADEHSDWDFQLITTRPAMFMDADWVQASGLGTAIVRVYRLGRLGTSSKVSLVLPEGEMDFVLLPARQMALARWLLRLRLVRRIPAAKRGLADMSLVLAGGYRVMKGEAEWGGFFQQAAAWPVPPLDDVEVLRLANGFVCDYVSARKKIERGELLAAQRWLHHQLAETNFALLAERRRRAGAPAYPDARRLEKLCDPATLDAVRVAATPDRESLRAALAKSAQTCRQLVSELVGDAWRWPRALD